MEKLCMKFVFYESNNFTKVITHDKSQSHQNIDPRIDTPIGESKLDLKKVIETFIYMTLCPPCILVSQNNQKAAMLVAEKSPARVELFPYKNAYYCRNIFA